MYTVEHFSLRVKACPGKKRKLPWSSTNLRAFSKKEGDPSISSKASKIGLPITIDFPGSPSVSVKEN